MRQTTCYVLVWTKIEAKEDRKGAGVDVSAVVLMTTEIVQQRYGFPTGVTRWVAWGGVGILNN